MIVVVSMIFFPKVALAQNDDSLYMHLKGDQRITLLMMKQSELNEAAWKNRRNQPGYRILVITTRDRNEAMTVKTELMKRYPEEKSYLLFQSPYYKIQIGNFKERKVAEDFRKDLQRIYTNNIQVIPATIEVTPTGTMGTSGN
jgi:hypothetical protein